MRAFLMNDLSPRRGIIAGLIWKSPLKEAIDSLGDCLRFPQAIGTGGDRTLASPPGKGAWFQPRVGY